MTAKRFLMMTSAGLAGGIGVGALGYAAIAGATWLRYGHAAPARGEDLDPLLDRFMPAYEVVERHEIRVAAPALETLAAMKRVNLMDSRLVRGIFRAREIVIGAPPSPRPSAGLLELTTSIGWGVLADVSGREIVMGAVTRPWEPNTTFRAIAPDRFAAFDEPGYVKIVWTLRVDADPAGGTLARTETRATTTDAVARAKFRGYWARFAPGISLIRRVAMSLVKRDAERASGYAVLKRRAT